MSIALTAVRKMLKGRYLDITTVRSVCEVIGANANGAAFDMLSALHCINYADMPRDVREGIPALMREVFSQAKIDDEVIQNIFKGVRV